MGSYESSFLSSGPLRQKQIRNVERAGHSSAPHITTPNAYQSTSGNIAHIPVLLNPPGLNRSLRIRTCPTLDGMQINASRHIIQSDIMARNGIVHAVDAVMLPPPSMMKVVSNLSDGEFSIVKQALQKTGFAMEVDGTPCGTLFLPSSIAFEQLGLEANRFLFESEEGERYLAALLGFTSHRLSCCTQTPCTCISQLKALQLSLLMSRPRRSRLIGL